MCYLKKLKRWAPSIVPDMFPCMKIPRILDPNIMRLPPRFFGSKVKHDKQTKQTSWESNHHCPLIRPAISRPAISWGFPRGIGLGVEEYGLGTSSRWEFKNHPINPRFFFFLKAKRGITLWKVEPWSFGWILKKCFLVFCFCFCRMFGEVWYFWVLFMCFFCFCIWF